MRTSRIIFSFIGILLILILLVGIIRFFSEKQLDDVTIGISCDESLMKKVDVFYVIPNYDGLNISNNLSWCEYILSFNKSLRLHGFEHNYNEFAIERDEEYLLESMKIFQKCFNQNATRFKAPQLNITDKNKLMVKKFLNYDGFFNQLFHKVYHCSDSGIPYNKFNNFF